MKQLLLSFLFFISFSHCSKLDAQDLIDSRQSSYYTYVYQLTDREAITIYKKGLEKIDEDYFHTLIHTYPTDSSLNHDLKPGHYLIAWASQENLNFELHSVSNVNIKVFNNGADMNLLLHDDEGQEIQDAKVTIDGKGVPFKEKTNSYFLKGSNKKGMLEVEYEGVNSFTFLERQINNPKFRRASRKILYSVPIKYLWIPIGTILRSPYDLFRSAKSLRPQGVFYYLTKPFRDIVRSISWGDPQGFVQNVFCLFDNYYCEEDNYKGYIVFNKPKYLPEDTVKFKAYITNKKGKPVNKELSIVLSKDYHYKSRREIGQISPYRKGGYAYEFALHDSLRLELDSRYTIDLSDKKGNTLIDGQFHYEDYELKSNHYEIRADKASHFKGEGLNLFASGKDINGLNLYDVQMNISLLSGAPDKIFSSQVILPDTLWQHQQTLESLGETKIIVPDSIFPDANFDYEIKASFRNAENKKKEKVLQLTYHYQKERFVFEAIDDSLLISHRINGNDNSKNVRFTAYNEEYDDVMEEREVALPTKVKINPFAYAYEINDQGKIVDWEVNSVSSQLELHSSRSSDSLFVKVENPRKLFFRYFIYELDREIEKGSGTELNFKAENRIKGKYFVSLHYIWGDEVKSENYEIPFKEKQLKIQVFEPGTVFPGQEAEVKIMVQDARGEAVENADLSAFAFTKKFENVTIPTVPYFGKTYKSRTLINSFDDKGNTLSESREALLLDWQLWNARMQLDSIEYYQFLFPLYNYTSTLAVEDTITQFAPYLVRAGKIQPIHIIYLDNRPIYFSVASKMQRYSFPVTSGYHQLRLRTNEYEVKVDSLFFQPNVKNIFSFLMDTINHRIQLVEKSSALSDHEKNLISNHLIAVENDYRNTTPTFLKQKDKVYWINQQGTFRENHLLGPVYAGNTSFIRSGKDTLEFDLEQRYHYSFQKNLIKMKFNENLHFSKYLNLIHPAQPLNEFVLTEDKIGRLSEKKVAKKQAEWRGFINPNITTENKGRIKIVSGHRSFEDRFVKNNILLKDNEPQFFQIYSGARSQIFHNLIPGKYTLFSLLDDNAYFKKSDIVVEKNATTLIIIQNDSLRMPDKTSYLINEKIKEIQETDNYSIIGRNEDFKEIKNAIGEEDRVNWYSGETIFGRVTDSEDGYSLPGVSVLIKGTTIGTVTDLEGNYSLQVPKNYGTLIFNFIGYMTEEISIGSVNELNVVLQPDIQHLQEVVVVGYGTQKMQSITGSVTTINSDGMINMALQGRLSGVLVNGAPGSTLQIQIRGSSSIDGSDNPLYVINGVPYSGKDLTISPDKVKTMEVLKGSSATAIYGSRASNGVIIITLKESADVIKTVVANNTFMEAMEASSAIRNDFSDYAYWEPKLRTDKNGIASFKVKFPDDITAWNTHVLGMTSKKQSGQYSGEIKAFKTVAGTLATPAFMVEGDSAALIGKALNYTSDSLDIAVAFEVGSVINYSANYRILHSKIDTLKVVAPSASDSVTFQYSITKTDGYFDGERRSVPIVKKGIKETVGNFSVLEKDTVFTYILPFKDKPFKISATSNVLEVLMEEAENVRRYEYSCNEQMASKVKALLALKKIKIYRGESFTYENLLKRLINNLQKNQKGQLWGWWPESETSYWISLHVLEALLAAEKDGFKVSFNRQSVIDLLVYNLETKENSDRLRILKILRLLDASVEYKMHLDSLEKRKLNFPDYVQVQLLKQKLSLPYSLDSLFKYQKETTFGGIYWENSSSQVYNNPVITTIYAYQLLKNSGKHNYMLPKIRNYFLETRRNTGYWRNTYESANILETILPDLLQEKEKYEVPEITVNGTDIHKDFPFELTYEADQQVSISKTGTGPVFLSVFQDFWNEAPAKEANDFIITTSFENGKASFEAGKETDMKVELTLKKDAEYVMIEVPIPAGFSYVSKSKLGFEDHREHYKNKVNIYFTSLKGGSYDFSIKLLPRFSGNYHINPAKAELMYFPVFYGRNEGKRIRVE